jgi:hypothetical protein
MLAVRFVPGACAPLTLLRLPVFRNYFLKVFPSDSHSRFPCGSRSWILFHGLLADSLSEGLHQVWIPINLTINKHPEYSLALAGSLLRGTISLENIPELTHLSIFDSLLQQ